MASPCCPQRPHSTLPCQPNPPAAAPARPLEPSPLCTPAAGTSRVLSSTLSCGAPFSRSHLRRLRPGASVFCSAATAVHRSLLLCCLRRALGRTAAGWALLLRAVTCVATVST